MVFALVSPDGDQGFPGEVKIEVSYTITEENELKIHLSCNSGSGYSSEYDKSQLF